MKFCPTCQKCFEQALDHCTDDQADLVESPPHTLVVAGKYRIERLISRGRNVVCEGTQLKTERPVAIKLIPAEVSERTHQKALGVACLGTRIDHQHVVKTCDYGQLSGGLTYVVTELVGGQTLREHLSVESPLAVAEATRVARQVADGLVSAHGCGVMHGGLNPSNIILARDFHGNADAKVFNFGLSECPARSSDGESLDADHARRYLSPEQLSDRGADERSDIYSLGVVLHEMLTGRTSCARSVKKEETPRRETCCEHLPEPLSALLTDALNEKPSARLLSAAEFASRLRLIERPEERPTPREPELAPPVSGRESLEELTDAPQTPVSEASVPPPDVVKPPVRKLGLVDDFAGDVAVESCHQRENRPAHVEVERRKVVSDIHRANTSPATLSHRTPQGNSHRMLVLILPVLLILTLGVYAWLAFKPLTPPPTEEAAVAPPKPDTHVTKSLSPESGDAGVLEYQSLLNGHDFREVSPQERTPRRGSEKRRAAVAGDAPGSEVIPVALPEQVALRPRRVTDERCMLTTSKGTLTLHSNGGSGEIAVGLNNEPSGAVAVTAATGDWSDIAVLAASTDDTGDSVYRVISVSGRAGTYHVTFNSPCGARRVPVKVE